MDTEKYLNNITGLKKDPANYLKMIYESYRDEAMVWLISKYNCNETDAKEIFQDAVVQLYENVLTEKLDHLTSSVKTYLFSICKYKFLDNRRGKNRQSNSLGYFQDVSDENNVENAIEDEHKSTLVQHALETLGNPCTEILSRFYYKGNSMAFIAEEMGYKNVETVRNQKYKCLNRLRKLIKS